MMIIKSLVGSLAHGINREDSDWDWRGIYVQPTSEILSLGYEYKSTQWLEGKEDHTNYEIGHFLMLATKGNPSVLELLKSPIIEHDSVWGSQILGLFPYLFTPQTAFNAFTGYSLNQRKKFLDDKDGRKYKYALAYIRTLYNLFDYLSTGNFSLKIDNQERKNTLIEIRDGRMSDGEIIDNWSRIMQLCKLLLHDAENKQDLSKVNQLLLDIRKHFWLGTENYSNNQGESK